MHPIIKALMGVVLIVVSVYYLAKGIPGILKPAWPDMLVVLNGAVPLFVLLLGVLIVLVEWDEWKIEQELKKEEEKAKRRGRRKK